MIDYEGPIFNGQADVLAAAMARDIEQEVADVGEAMVWAELPHVLQNPTGRYQSVIRSEPAGAGTDVTDGGIVYGPWLEGIGSRNYPDTRFRGYATFRRVTQALDGRVELIAEPIVDRYVGRMG